MQNLQKIHYLKDKRTPACRHDTLQCKNLAIKTHKHSNSVMQCPGPCKETSDHRLHRSLPEENFGHIHQSPACKTNSRSVRSVHSNPEPPCLRSSALQGWKGQLPACSTLSEMRGSLGASVVWDEMCSCFLLFFYLHLCAVLLQLKPTFLFTQPAPEGVGTTARPM